MKLIVCTDSRGGMMFNKRRTTSDVVVTADILRESSEGRLLITPYSEKIFKTCEAEGYAPEGGAVYTISADPISDAKKGDTIFLEERSARARLADIDTIIIYNWTIIYPYDYTFDIDPGAEGFVLAEQYDFTGYNHDLITKEVYRREM